MHGRNWPAVDEELIQVVGRLAKGEEIDKSFAYLSHRYRPRLHRYFTYHKFSTQDAEDLVQETFRRVYTSIGTLREPARFESWLFQIARNVRLTERASIGQQGEEQKHPQDTVDPAVIPTFQDPLAASIREQRLQRTWEAVERLSPQQKQCLILRAVHEMSYDEIATVLRLSVRTVRNHLREARLNLKRHLREA